MAGINSRMAAVVGTWMPSAKPSRLICIERPAWAAAGRASIGRVESPVRPAPAVPTNNCNVWRRDCNMALLLRIRFAALFWNLSCHFLEPGRQPSFQRPQQHVRRDADGHEHE